MNKEWNDEISNKRNVATFLNDLRLLFKGPVLIANVLPVFTGFWLAVHFSGSSIIGYLDLFWLTMVGSTLVMAGALAINNWYDVDIDSIMNRTKNRPTVTGHFSLKTVLIIGLLLTIFGLTLLMFVSMESAIYAFIGWFTYVVLYTVWSKRRYSLNTVIGSVSGAVSPLIGWAAIQSSFQLVPIILFLILFIWQMPHTFAIAIRKYDDYKAANVAMLPVVYGLSVTKRQIFVYTVCLLPLPFYLISLGTTFIVIASLLNVAGVIVSLLGFFAKDDMKWARLVFLFSVNYIMVLFLSMVLVTLPVFK
ncbi:MULTISPECIES: heme o synthase [unclassified Bacillus (in: firmicutes)]|uniref:heme o synthase n=1 Tax=unclassified Bacillus (in: firmicutes) TaxID=185979 RepID=UPI000B83C7E4|nr:MULTISPECIES: heme o synthase [unclassified Bacillus (in: firmicutes)]